MDNFVVIIWGIQNKSKKHDPDFIFNNIVAVSPEMALRKVLQDNDFHEAVDAEVIWNNELNRQKFENYSL